MKRFKAFVLCVCLVFSSVPTAWGATLGPAASYEELLALVDLAADGDVIEIVGDISADGYAPLCTQVSVRITSSDGSMAALRNLRLENASISFANIDLRDSLAISGTSHVEITSGVNVIGSPGKSGLSFEGNGTLLLYPNATVTGGAGCDGVTIAHHGGEFYAGIEGIVRGGDGSTGGSGMTISPLLDAGTLMISGSISGGAGSSVGGHALNLYGLSGNAFITVSGTLEGGAGAVGGDGIQLVAVSDRVNVGIEGRVAGGRGEDFGGDALMLMNVSGASTIHLEGVLTGGDVTSFGAQPGLSLLVVGETSASRTRVGDCHLQDGRDLAAELATPEPDITPLPEITSSVEDPDSLSKPEEATPSEPEVTPAPPILEETPAPTEPSIPGTTASPDETPITTETPAPSESTVPPESQVPQDSPVVETSPSPETTSTPVSSKAA